PRLPGQFSHRRPTMQDSGLEQSFIVLRLIPHDHVLALMRSCSALINPSAFEGWSTTVEEAKAMGTPMILSSLRVHKEQAGEKAVYFHKDSAHQLATILGNFQPLPASQRQRLADHSRIAAAADARRFADRFTDL